MKVIWLWMALRNLDKIATFVARDNAAAAVRMVRRVQNATLRLGSHPNSGHPSCAPGTRELIMSGIRFTLPYRVKRGRIEILHVLHHSR